MADEDSPSGIKSFSVGFGSTAGARQALRPAPPYRLLIAGDFGLSQEGERLRLAGDVAELLRETRPRIEVTVGNLLGSFPVTVSDGIELGTLADLRPATLLRQFGHHRAAAEALTRGSHGFLNEAGQHYDKLAALLASGRGMPSRSAADTDLGESGDGLDSLFDLVDAPAGKTGSKGGTPAGLIADFIAENVAPSRGGQSAKDAVPEKASTLLDAQALAFLSHPDLTQVLENWHGLRLLQEVAGRARGIEVTVLQVAVASDVGGVFERLAGDDGAMHDELFDLLLFANRCPARTNGADMLKALAEVAETFDTVALATLTADFAGVSADELAAMDAPHQLLTGAGFEVFNALGAHAAAKRLGVFWNDVLIAEGSAENPELYVPAAWVAAILALRSVANSGWPGCTTMAGNELSGLPVAVRSLRGRQVAVATRSIATDESTASLATAGIATLNGCIDRDSVAVVRSPLFFKADKHQVSSLDDQLVLARLGQLLQAVLPEALGGQGSPSQKADVLESRFAELAQSIPQAPKFGVKAGDDGEGNPVLQIAVDLPEGVSARRRFDFEIPV